MCQRQVHEKSIQRLWSVRSLDWPKLFVRAVATTEELSRVVELRDVLAERFGGRACLLIIVDFQPEKLTISVDDQPYLLVILKPAEPHKEADVDTGAPFLEAIRIGVDWITGVALDATVVDHLSTLQRMVAPSDAGLNGMAGFHAFSNEVPACWTNSLSLDEGHISIPTTMESATAREEGQDGSVEAVASKGREHHVEGG